MKLSRKVLYAILVVLIAGIYLQLTQQAEQERVASTEQILKSIEQKKQELVLK